MMIEEIAAKRQKDEIDRISELPDFILHVILSKLGTKEACRATVLSKRWYEAWSSIPVLDFQPQYFKKGVCFDSWKYDDEFYDDDMVESYVGFIDKTMQRYDVQKYRIKRLYLEFPKVDEKLEPLVDKWIGIAVQNQIEELHVKILLDCSPDCKLPESIYNAKSLKVLNCQNVNLAYNNTIELISLEYLTLLMGTINEDMLQRIVSFSPLIELDISKGGLKRISLPWTKNVNVVKASPLRKFVYHGLCEFIAWPWNMNVVALKNLRRLEIHCATITDDILYKVVCGLVALESLVLTACTMMNCIKISSISLKEFRIVEGIGLSKTIIDAPNLVKFWYHCEVEASLSLIRVHEHCNAHFFPVAESLTSVWFAALKKFLIETNCFKSLVMDLSECDQIMVVEDEQRNDVTGPPYKLRELKLNETSAWDFTEASLTVFLDGLFWSCQPDLVSMTASFQNKSAEVCYVS
ncbi:hypothetical protein RND81_05G080600 [Saponaria officinalis]|uniref:F-box domain-containing protein n=1 Tax=Saponaria officinalis TaxID=3572 RepID=A0AAW1KWN2_SAPOF